MTDSRNSKKHGAAYIALMVVVALATAGATALLLITGTVGAYVVTRDRETDYLFVP